jgi:hypothetical protein
VITTSITGTQVPPPTGIVDALTHRQSRRQTKLPPIKRSDVQLGDDDDDANADADTDVSNADHVTETKPNFGATSRCALEEDAKLTSTVTNTRKKKWGKKHTMDWVAVAKHVPGRVEERCRCR